MFNEHYTWKSWDSIKVWNLIKNDNIDFRLYLLIYMGHRYGYGPFVSWFEMHAVKYGIDNMANEVDEEHEESVAKLIFYSQKNREAVQNYKDTSTETEKQQIQRLIHIINRFINLQDEDYPKESSLVNFIISLTLMNSPNLALQSISEIYDIDFFELYQLLDHHERVTSSIMENIVDLVPVPARELSDLFDIYPENMIYFWKESQFQSIPAYLKN